MVLAALLAGATAMGAQTPRGYELRAFVGADMAMGAMRDVVDDAALLGVQAGARLTGDLRLVGTFGWMPTQTRFAVADDGVNVLQYDAMLELNVAHRGSGPWQVRPFVGLGAGARSYRYDSSALDDNTCAVGVGALGVAWQYRSAAVRTELRDNVFCYETPVAGERKSSTRNDLAMMLGVAYHFR
jgi:hypothetical protein